MNKLANLAEVLDANIESVRKSIGSDPRIGYHFLYPGCGYGDSCFHKDVQALQRTARIDAGIELKVLNAVEDANDAQKYVLSKKIKVKFGDDLTGKLFAVWCLAFKPNTDDMREAPSRYPIADLFEAGASICAYGPVAMPETKRIFGNEPRFTYAENPMAALDGTDALVIVTEWKEFRSPDFEVIRQILKTPVIFYGRNLYDPALVRGAGIDYQAIGRMSLIDHERLLTNKKLVL